MIRLAKKEDIEQIVPLIMIILKDMELPLLTELGEEKVSEMMMEACEIEGYRYDYRRALVIDENNQIKGVAFGYLHSDEPTIDEAWNMVMNRNGYLETQPLFIDKETFPNEWYLDTLVVDPKTQGKGYGTQLLKAVDQVAIDQGSHKVGLNVDKQNPAAKRLYERLGFSVVGEITLSSHQYEHMQKEV